jgi:hypothetical protein
VYVEQPKGFVEPGFPNHVYKLKKALYGLKPYKKNLISSKGVKYGTLFQDQKELM